MRIIIVCILVLHYSFLFSQKEDFIWTMGYLSNTDTSELASRFGGIDIDFNFEPPKIDKIYRDIYFSASSVSICDEHGKLVFCSNGCSIWGKNNEDIIKDLVYDYNWIAKNYCEYGFNFIQGLIPFKLNDKYYLIHTDINEDENIIGRVDTAYATCFRTEIDGRLSLEYIKKPLIAENLSLGRFSAVKHANGKDWWIVMPSRIEAKYYKILLTSDGEFINKGEQYIGNKHHIKFGTGQNKFSPDGKRYVKFNSYDGMDIYDFNRNTGEFSNSVYIPFWRDPTYVPSCGVEISPNSRFAYISITDTLWQYDLQQDNIEQSKTFIEVFDGYQEGNLQTAFFLMQLAPNNKIYMCTTSGSLYLHVINNPNEKGKNCHFVQRDIKLPTYNAFTMPYFPNYRLGPESVGTDEDLNTANILPFIAPNPSSNHIEIINLEYGQQVQVYSVAGEIMFTGNEKNIDVSAWSNGIYFVKISDNFKNYFLKFIKI